MGITKCAHDNDLKVRATQRLFTHRHSQLAIPFIDPAGNVEGWFQFVSAKSASPMMTLHTCVPLLYRLMNTCALRFAIPPSLRRLLLSSAAAL